MEAAVECTHCGVVMTSWSAPGSPIRYYQCPFCARTHSSLYGEVFRRGAGARVVERTARAAEAPRAATASGVPMASPEDVRWSRVRASAARWFERVAEDARRNAPAAPRPATRPAPARATAPAPRVDAIPEADPADVVELAPATARRKVGR